MSNLKYNLGDIVKLKPDVWETGIGTEVEIIRIDPSDTTKLPYKVKFPFIGECFWAEENQIECKIRGRHESKEVTWDE